MFIKYMHISRPSYRCHAWHYTHSEVFVSCTQLISEINVQKRLWISESCWFWQKICLSPNLVDWHCKISNKGQNMSQKLSEFCWSLAQLYPTYNNPGCCSYMEMRCYFNTPTLWQITVANWWFTLQFHDKKHIIVTFT